MGSTKKLIWIVILGALFFCAGSFRAPQLLILAAAVLALFLLLLVQSFVTARCVSVALFAPEEGVRRGEGFRCTAIVENRSVFPVTRLRLRLKLSNGLTETLYGSVPARGRARLSMKVIPHRCGLLRISADKLIVRDMLAVFTRRRAVDEAAAVAVLPVQRALPVLLEQLPFLTADDAEVLGHLDGQPPEVREIADYHPGDPVRDIHWKLSARHDTWLIKRYSEEVRPRVSVMWRFLCTTPADFEAAEAQWEIAYAVSAGLLAAGAAHDICWHDMESGAARAVRILDLRALDAFITARLLGAAQYPEDAFTLAAEGFRRENAGETVLSLTGDLKLLRQDVLLLPFTKENYATEIESARIRL